MNNRGRLVYSSGPAQTGPRGETLCKRCGAHPCRCEPSDSVLPEKQSIHVRFEKSGRKGKTVTVADAFRLTRSEATKLLKNLKKKCGGGGTLKATTLPSGEPAFAIEVQGDHVIKIKAELQTLGYRTKG